MSIPHAYKVLRLHRCNWPLSQREVWLIKKSKSWHNWWKDFPSIKEFNKDWSWLTKSSFLLDLYRVTHIMIFHLFSISSRSPKLDHYNALCLDIWNSFYENSWQQYVCNVKTESRESSAFSLWLRHNIVTCFLSLLPTSCCSNVWFDCNHVYNLPE